MIITITQVFALPKWQAQFNQNFKEDILLTPGTKL